MCVKQLEEGRHEVENQYTRSVRREGNTKAKSSSVRSFVSSPESGAALGDPPQWAWLTEKYKEFDAELKFGLTDRSVEESSECIAGLVLQGVKKPHECPAFGTRCTPEHPLGAPMVSSEGACAAYYRYRRDHG
jgi:hydrogenase expression/formation protein HypD